MTRTSPAGTPPLPTTAADTIEPTTIKIRPSAPVRESLFLELLRTTDHKLIGRMYMVTSFVFFMIGGLLPLLMRAELARPGMQFLSNEQYNQLFTMHGTIMLLLFATSLVFAFANLVLPLQIGSPDLPSVYAAQLCIERLLRLRPGQRAEVRYSDRSGLMHAYRWMRAFDMAHYGVEYASAADPADSHLVVARRRAG
jgi:Cytochrome C and Quinol oxidase polypeptide I